jgi:signal transduction histidine kinase
MRAIAFVRHRPVEVAWVAFAGANVAAMVLWPTWEAIPFHVVWISLTLVYGFRLWGRWATAAILGVVVFATGAPVLKDALEGIQRWDELFEVPLLTVMFLAIVWYARRRREALERQERFLHDASHELRTPVTIARGHLEIARRSANANEPEIEIALDELERIEGIVERLLLLAKAGQPGFVVAVDLDIESFLDDVFMRWSEVAPRAWQLGPVAAGTVRADPEALRNALDALIENAVRYTDVGGSIELRSAQRNGVLAIEVEDSGAGIPQDVVGHIFERFARGDSSRTRAEGGVGLGLAIVDAIARAHGGRCTVFSSRRGSVFTLTLPRG